MGLTINLDPKIYDGKWEEYQPGVRALIAPYTRRIIRKIMAAATVVDPATGEGRVDPELWDQHLYRAIILDIEGLTGPDGEPLPRSDAAIDAVCDQVMGFAAWAYERSRKAAASMAQAEEAELKNSSRSHGGKPKGRKG